MLTRVFVYIVSTITCSCVADPDLLFVDSENLRAHDLATGVSSVLIDSVLRDAFDLDYHRGNQKVYVSDLFYRRIFEVDMSVAPPTLSTLVSGLDLPSGVAVDWINNNLYWTDQGIFILYNATKLQFDWLTNRR